MFVCIAYIVRGGDIHALLQQQGDGIFITSIGRLVQRSFPILKQWRYSDKQLFRVSQESMYRSLRRNERGGPTPLNIICLQIYRACRKRVFLFMRGDALLTDGQG